MLITPHVESDVRTFKIAARIANEYFDLNFDTLVYGKSTVHFDSNDDFLRDYDGSVNIQLLDVDISNRMAIRRQKLNHVRQYVMRTSHSNGLNHLLRTMKENSLIDQSGHFIMICEHSTNSKSICNAKQVFNICWRYRIANVVLLHRSKEGEIVISTYFPQSLGQCHNTKPIILDRILKAEEYAGLINPFPNKVCNFNRCPLIISTVPFPPFLILQTDEQTGIRLGGSDGPLIHILAEMLNATLKVITPKDEPTTGYFNGSVWTGCLGDVFTERANVTLTASFMTTHRLSVFKATYPRRMEYFVWVLPPRRLRPAWMKLMSPLDLQLRISLLIFLLCLFIAIIILKETKLRRLWNAYFTQDPVTDGIYIETCAVFLGQVGSWTPHKMVLSFVLALWVWFTFFLRSSYQGALVGALKHDAYEPVFNTLLEAARAEFDIGGPPDMIDCLADEPDLHNLYKIVSVKENYQYFNKMATGSLDFVLLCSISQLSSFNIMANNSKPLNVLPQLAILLPSTNYLSQHSSLAGAIDTAWSRISASGIDVKFSSEYDVIKTFLRLENEKLNEAKDILTMHHMKVCFAVLMLGHIFSSVVFVTELLWQKYKG